MISNMPPQKKFSQVPQATIQRSVFNRTHAHKTTMNTGLLVPLYVDEILPGDDQNVKINIFARLSSTLDFPIMDNIHFDIHCFYCPIRILWKQVSDVSGSFKKFMGERTPNPDSSIDFTIPQVTSAAGDAVQSLSDYLGIPPGKPYSISSMWHRAYVKIWNEWFRDENLQDSLPEFSGDGPEISSLYPLKDRGKRHDYFTSCLPWPQKIDPVSIALTGNAPIIGDGKSLGLYDAEGAVQFHGLGTFSATGSTWAAATSADWYNQTLPHTDGGAPAGGGNPDFALGVTPVLGESGMIADLSQVTAVLIEDLRLAVATQQFLELQARGGTRYIEILASQFGVTAPDYRLQRPEYLGGSTQMMHVNPVTQTSESGTTFQGEQAGFGTFAAKSSYSKSFTEHGVIICLGSVRADLTYQQGIAKMFTRTELLDFYTPTFANLGEQAVLNQEIFYNNDANDDLVFGYQERWAEYRYYPSKITGRFRSDVADSLDTWHLSQQFLAVPPLGAGFIQELVPLDRVLTVESTATVPQIILDSIIEVRHARPLPVYSTPGLGRL